MSGPWSGGGWPQITKNLIYDFLEKSNKYNANTNTNTTWNCHAKLIFQLIKWHTYKLQTRFSIKKWTILTYVPKFCQTAAPNT